MRGAAVLVSLVAFSTGAALGSTAEGDMSPFCMRMSMISSSCCESLPGPAFVDGGSLSKLLLLLLFDEESDSGS